MQTVTDAAEVEIHPVVVRIIAGLAAVSTFIAMSLCIILKEGAYAYLLDPLC